MALDVRDGQGSRATFLARINKYIFTACGARCRALVQLYPPRAETPLKCLGLPPSSEPPVLHSFFSGKLDFLQSDAVCEPLGPLGPILI